MKNQKFDIMKKYTFRTFAGKKYILDLDPEITVLECKEIFNKESASDCDAKLIRMVCKATVLEDPQKLSSYDIKDSDVISVFTPKRQSSKSSLQSPVKEVDTTSSPSSPNVRGSPRPENPVKDPLPEFQASNSPDFLPELYSSPEYLSAIDQLMAKGYPKADVELVLKATLGDIDVSLEMLESGLIPTEEQIQDNQNRLMYNRQLRKRLKKNPEQLFQCIAEIEQVNHNLGLLYRAQPELLIQVLDLDPINFGMDPIDSETFSANSKAPKRSNSGGAGMAPPPSGQAIQPSYIPSTKDLLASYTDEEKASIKKLQELTRYSIDVIVHVFEACDKNEVMAAHFILEINP